MTRTGLLALVAICALCPALAVQKAPGESVEEREEPPLTFPESKAVPFHAEMVPTAKTPLEAIDMNNSADAKDTELVHHTQVKDPGTTHAEGTESSRGSIHACTLPNLRERNSTARASDWLADSGNVTKVCHLPVQWLHGASGTLRVCSIPHDAWNSSYTVTDGTIPKELLAQLNTTSVKCVTPSEALSNTTATAAAVAADDSIANGSIPSAWLRDSNDTIYIYIIPQEWLRNSQTAQGSASEVEELNRDKPNVASSTPNPATTTGTPAAVTTSSLATTTAAAAAVVVTSTNASSAGNASAQSVVSTGVTEGAALANVTNTTVATVATPPAKSVKSDGTTSAPTVTVSTTERSTEETTKPSKLKEETTKPAVKPKQETTKATAKPTEEATKATEKPVVATEATIVATKKPDDKKTAKPSEATTEVSKQTVKPEVPNDADNEIPHGSASLHEPAALSQSHSDHNHAASSGKTAFLQPTESAAILAGVFVAIALLGYAGLLLWRRVLEKRYGNREMLVNEDDDFDTSDMRHFEL